MDNALVNDNLFPESQSDYSQVARLLVSFCNQVAYISFVFFTNTEGVCTVSVDNIGEI